MKKEDKGLIIENLAQSLNEYNHVYIADTAGLNAEDTSALRRLCHAKEVKLVVVKNKLLIKAFDKAKGDYSELIPILKGSSTMMLSNEGSTPAKLIKEFRTKKREKPAFKAAYVEEAVYTGEENLEVLLSVKSKNELIGELVGLLQSPVRNVMSALQSGGNILTGVLKTLSEKE
jgi:large subunit ribosomal protein L10